MPATTCTKRRGRAIRGRARGGSGQRPFPPGAVACGGRALADFARLHPALVVRVGETELSVDRSVAAEIMVRRA